MTDNNWKIEEWIKDVFNTFKSNTTQSKMLERKKTEKEKDE